MTADPLERYRSLALSAKAPTSLPDRVLEQARAQTSTHSVQATAASEGIPTTKQATTPVVASDAASVTAPAPVTPGGRRTANRPSAPSFSIKRRRAAGFAFAACAVLALGIGALALSPLAASSGNNADTGITAPQSNFFTLSAFADEGGQPANGPVTLAADDFMPVRTSAGYQYNGETGGYEDFCIASRAYNLNLTCSGENVASMTYELVGEGVSLNNVEITNVAGQDHPDIDIDQSSSFTQDFADQGDKGDGTYFARHEIAFGYTLTEDEERLFDEEMATVTHKEVSDGSTIDPAEVAAWTEANNRLEAALALHDAQYLSRAKIILTATFTDGTSATKTYQLAPVDNFEQAYAEYLSLRSSWRGIEEPDFPALYTIKEIA